MKKQLTVLTGASRGMGYAMAMQLMASQHDLICISRQRSAQLQSAAERHGVLLEQWAHDLSDAVPACEQLKQWLASHGDDAYGSVTLINNAASLPMISPLREASLTDVAKTLRVGLESAIQLTATFLGSTSHWTAPRYVLNISSGNGRRAMASQSIYSAVKAGMDHYTRCVALEEAALPNGAKLCSLAPGIIDTDMQMHLRASAPEKFPSHSMFVEYKESGQLLSPEQGAARVLAFLARADFGANPVADVRDA